MVQDECVCPDTVKMESVFLLGAGLMTAAFVAVILLSPSTLVDDDWEIVDVCINEHNPNQSHEHATLKIFIDGAETNIPANIGVDDDASCNPGMRGIHTHDATGKLHVETPSSMDAPVGAFFEIWDETFNENQILNSVADKNDELVMYVNGELNDEYQNYGMQDGDVIEIYYRDKQD